eukprot:GILJ01003810.1.p1 GENE.GILJ01003810.1~~GILJ01003810.1.p1  ORF type:complete len:315 (-),score=39.81 GILJ01003810.1:59-958(-)
MDVSISLPSALIFDTGDDSRGQYVAPGDIITSDIGYMRGHGTYEENGKLLASVAGIVERVNKLISVRPLKSRYTAEIGDVVVGRIVQVGNKRWRVDVNAHQDATLQLSAINLPGGIQRRRSEEDQLQMRQFFAEEDLMSAEVQAIHSDGGVALHTRSMKYGKLMNGLFIQVMPALIKRGKHHFHTLSCGVDVILGNNGYIWISEPRVAGPQEGLNYAGDTSSSYKEVTLPIREKICRVRNAIFALNSRFISIYPQTIMDTYEESLSMQLSSKDLLRPDVASQVTERARQTALGNMMDMS